jgi:hypothetical protein
MLPKLPTLQAKSAGFAPSLRKLARICGIHYACLSSDCSGSN